MSGEYLAEVRDQLASRATQTSLNSLRERGLNRVRVIRSSAVLALIQEAVNRALADRGLSSTEEERDELAEASQEIFQGMMREQIEAAKEEAKQLLDEYRNRLQEQHQRIEKLETELEERDRTLQGAQSRSAELTAELQVLRKRSETGSSDSLLGELRALRTDLEKRESTPVEPRQDPAMAEALQSKLDAIGKELGSELARIGRKVGISKDDGQPQDLSSLFTHIDAVESNIEQLEAKESKGAAVDDALARMRRLRGEQKKK